MEIAICLTSAHNFSHRDDKKGYIEQIERKGGTIFPRLTGEMGGKAYQCKIMMDHYCIPENYYQDAMATKDINRDWDLAVFAVNWPKEYESSCEMIDGIEFDKETPIAPGTMIGVFGYPAKIKGADNHYLWG